MSEQQGAREHALMFLRGGIAHLTMADALENFPLDRVNDHVPGIPYSPWQLLEHVRITQKDILDFMRDPNYRELRWPQEYWPAEGATADAATWERTVGQFEDDLASATALAADPATDMFARVPWGDGQTMLREFLLIANHNAYHIGEMVLLRRALGIWKG